MMSQDASDTEIVPVVSQNMGYETRPVPGRQRTAIGLVGNHGRGDTARLEALPCVHQGIHVIGEPCSVESAEQIRMVKSLSHLPNFADPSHGTAMRCDNPILRGESW